MSEKRGYDGGEQIGSISSVDTCSTALNGQANLGAVKPIMRGGDKSPGGTRPERAPEQKVTMPK